MARRALFACVTNASQAIFSAMEDLRTGSGLNVQGWHSRGYLPHYDGGATTQFITLRLEDSVPPSVIDKWKVFLTHLKEEEAKRILQERIEKYLDQGYGKCFLRIPPVAKEIEDALREFEGERYRLHAWVIMPNHLHLLFTQIEPNTLAQIMHSFKSYSAKEANRILNCSGSFWQAEYFDREIRDGNHYANAFGYIERNPVKARLCKRAEDWRFSSAWYRARAVG